MAHVQNIIDTLQYDRSNSEQRFSTIYKWIVDFIPNLRFEIEKPRFSANSIYRANPNVDSTEAYYRVAIYLPFMDTVVLQQPRLTFDNKVKIAANFDLLLPVNCFEAGIKEVEFYELWKTYSTTLAANNVHPNDVDAIHAQVQYRQWVMKWKREFTDKSPVDHISIIEACDALVFPTIHSLLKIASILPI